MDTKGAESNSSRDRSSRARASGGYLILLALSAMFGFGLSFGNHFFPAMLWFAPIPLLLFAFETPWFVAGIVSFLVVSASFLDVIWAYGYSSEAASVLSYLGHGTSPTAIYLPVFTFALSISLIVLCTRFVVLSLRSWTSILIYPSLWVAYEFLLLLILQGHAHFSIAYSQAFFLPLIQIVSITGMWGVTFLLALIPSGIAIAWFHRRRADLAFGSLTGTFALLAIALAYGLIRLSAPPAMAPIRVGAVAIPRGTSDSAVDSSEGVDELPTKYLGAIASLAEDGCQVVVCPERVASVQVDKIQRVLQLFAESSKAHGTTIVIGLRHAIGLEKRDTAAAFLPSLEQIYFYDRMDLIPGFEIDDSPDDDPLFIFQTSPPWGIILGEDMEFPNWSRVYSERGVGLVLVPALDDRMEAPLETRISIIRGVEGRFAVVRASQQGWLSISDSRGHLLKFRPTSSTETTEIRADVSPGQARTIYARIGDVFAWLCLVIVGALVASALVARFTTSCR